MAIPSYKQWITTLTKLFLSLWQQISAIPVHIWHKFIIALVTICIAILITNTLTNIVHNPYASVLNDTKNASVDKKQNNTIDLNAMIQWQMFGKHDTSLSNSTKNNNPPQKAIERTKLDIKLLGIMYTQDKKIARALIEKDKKSHQYKIGDTLPLSKNIKLHDIHTNRIIINNNGSLEELWLHEQTKTFIKSKKNDNTITNIAPPSLPYQLSPVWISEGNLQGYRINRTTESEEFEALGFIDNDIIIAVNQTPINSPQSASLLFQELQKGGLISITVLRGDQEINFDTNIPTKELPALSTESD